MNEMSDLITVIKDNTQAAVQLKASIETLRVSNENTMQLIATAIERRNESTKILAASIIESEENEHEKTRSHFTIRLLMFCGILTFVFGGGILIAEHFLK